MHARGAQYRDKRLLQHDRYLGISPDKSLSHAYAVRLMFDDVLESMGTVRAVDSFDFVCEGYSRDVSFQRNRMRFHGQDCCACNRCIRRQVQAGNRQLLSRSMGGEVPTIHVQGSVGLVAKKCRGVCQLVSFQ